MPPTDPTPPPPAPAYPLTALAACVVCFVQQLTALVFYLAAGNVSEGMVSGLLGGMVASAWPIGHAIASRRDGPRLPPDMTAAQPNKAPPPSRTTPRSFRFATMIGTVAAAWLIPLAVFQSGCGPLPSLTAARVGVTLDPRPNGTPGCRVRVLFDGVEPLYLIGGSVVRELLANDCKGTP